MGGWGLGVVYSAGPSRRGNNRINADLLPLRFVKKSCRRSWCKVGHSVAFRAGPQAGYAETLGRQQRGLLPMISGQRPRISRPA